jgi:hypothetical protein
VGELAGVGQKISQNLSQPLIIGAESLFISFLKGEPGWRS